MGVNALPEKTANMTTKNAVVGALEDVIYGSVCLKSHSSSPSVLDC